MLKPAIDGPSSDPNRLTVVKIVDVGASKRQRVYPPINAKLLNLQVNLDRVSTGDPLSPRRLPAFFGNALFSSIYISMRYGQPVEPCGILLSLEEPGSYKIIYSGLPPPDVPLVVPAEPPYASASWSGSPSSSYPMARYPLSRFS
jgi:hypothetical protein